MVNKLIAALVVGGTAALAATAAQATVFTGSYSVSSFTDTNGTGLNIQTAPIAPGLNFNLTEGQTTGWFNLFKIWTTEEFWNADDANAKPISVSFSFSAPPPPFGGPAGGTTDGHWAILTSWGSVEWDEAYVDINFGALNDGVLRVWLSDETFNDGGFLSGTGLNPGEENGAIVQAKFKLIHDATVVDVPEPATLALFGLGLLGVGVARRRISR